MNREIARSEVSEPEGLVGRGRYPADLAEFLQDATIGVMTIDVGGRVRWSNKTEYERLGLTRDEFVGKPYRDFFAEGEEADDVLQRLLAGEVLHERVVTLRHASGARRFVAIDGEGVRRPDDTHIRLLTRDLTAERVSQAATRFQAEMLNAVGQAVIARDLDGYVTYWNKAAERRHGWPAEDAIGKSIFDLIAPEGNHPRDEEVLAAFESGGPPWSGEFTVRRPDGSQMITVVTITPLFDDAGKHVGFIGVSADISAAKAAESEARARQRQLEAMGESLPAIVAMASQKRGFYYFNQTWFEFSGLDPLVMPVPWTGVVHEDDLQSLRDAFQQVLRGHTMQCETRLRRCDGQYRWFLVRAVPLMPVDGESGTAIITAVDVSDIKLASQELESTKNQLETVLKAIGDGVTAHDRDGQMVYANDAAARLIGFPSAEALLAAPTESLADGFEIGDEFGKPLDVEEMPAARLLAGKPASEMLVSFRRKDSPDVHYSLVNAAQVLDQAGQMEYVVDVFRDVTDRVLSDREREYLLRREREARISAERATERVARLQSITAKLAGAWTPEEAGEAVLMEAIQSLDADAATVLLVDAEGQQRPLSTYGIGESDLKNWRALPASMPRPGADVIRTGEAVFFGSREELKLAYPAFANALPGFSPRIACAPLKTGGRVLGGLILGFKEERPFSPEDREFVVSIAQQCALAIGRTQLYQAERHARTQAEDAEGRYRILAEAMPQIVWTSTPDGFIDYYNAQFYKFTGLTPGEGYGWDWESLVHLDDIKKVVSAWKYSLETGTEFEVEARMRQADGYYLWVLTRALPLQDSHGRTVRWLGTITDIDGQKRNQERFGFLAQASAVLSSSLDYEETLVAVARLAVPLLGDWCAVHVVGADGNPCPLVVAALDEETRALAEEVERTEPIPADAGYGYSYALRTGLPRMYRDIAGKAVPGSLLSPLRMRLMERLSIVSAICVPVVVRGKAMASISLGTAESQRRYTDRDLETAIEFARHISFAIENALLYREGQKIQEELRLANEAKDEFLGLMSHELRTPITTLYGGAKILRSRGKFLDEEHKDSLLSDIETEAEGMHRMIEDLLVLARTGSGEQVSTEPILANRLVDKVVRSFQLHKPGRPISVNYAPDLLPVMADNTYMEQILRNLMSNADKYSPPGVAIELDLQNHGDEVEIRVLDRGNGIDPEEAELIFTRFYRAERTARGVRGMGLGLTVCRKLVEAQGGRIWAEARAGGGTEVAFALPAFCANYDDA